MGFLNIAKASTAEHVTQIYIGIEIGYIDRQLGLTLIDESELIAASLGKLIKTKQNRLNEELAEYDFRNP